MKKGFLVILKQIKKKKSYREIYWSHQKATYRPFTTELSCLCSMPFDLFSILSSWQSISQNSKTDTNVKSFPAPTSLTSGSIAAPPALSNTVLPPGLIKEVWLRNRLWGHLVCYTLLTPCAAAQLAFLLVLGGANLCPCLASWVVLSLKICMWSLLPFT